MHMYTTTKTVVLFSNSLFVFNITIVPSVSQKLDLREESTLKSYKGRRVSTHLTSSLSTVLDRLRRLTWFFS